MARVVSFRMLLRPIVRGTVVGAALLSINVWLFVSAGPGFRRFRSVFVTYPMMAIESFLIALIPSAIVATLVLLVAYVQIRRSNFINPRAWQPGVLFSAALLGAVPALMVIAGKNSDSDLVFVGMGPLIGSMVGGIVFVRGVQRQIDRNLVTDAAAR